MKLNTLTERQRLILLQAIISLNLNRAFMDAFPEKTTIHEIQEDYDYLLEQLARGKGE